MSHKITVEVSGFETEKEAADFLFHQIKTGRLNSDYEKLQEEFTSFRGAKIQVLNYDSN